MFERVILNFLAKNEEDNLSTLVNACQHHRKRQVPADVLPEAVDAVASLCENGQLEVYSVDPQQPLHPSKKLPAGDIRKRVIDEAGMLSWDEQTCLWKGLAVPEGRSPYLWFALTKR